MKWWQDLDKKRLAEPLSLDAVPVVAVPVALWVMGWFSYAKFAAVFLVFGFAIPFATVYVLYAKKKITTLRAKDIEDRRMVFKFTWFWGPVSVFIFWIMQAPPPMAILVVAYGGIICSFAFLLSRYDFKASVHAGTWAGVTGALVVQGHPLLAIAALLFTIAVGWSRVLLNEHSEEQVVAGVWIGFSWFTVGYVIFHG